MSPEHLSLLQLVDEPIKSSPQDECCSARSIWISKKSPLFATLLVLSIFSTVFSGIYLGIALANPRYENNIQPDGGILSISVAQELVNLLARLIELTFATVFIAFLGQAISRKAFAAEGGKGITLVR